MHGKQKAEKERRTKTWSEPSDLECGSVASKISHVAFLHIPSPLPPFPHNHISQDGPQDRSGQLVRPCGSIHGPPGSTTRGDWVRLASMEMKRQYVDVFAPRSRPTASSQHMAFDRHRGRKREAPRHPRLLLRVCCTHFSPTHGAVDVAAICSSATKQTDRPKRIGSRESASRLLFPFGKLRPVPGSLLFWLPRALAIGPCRPNISSTVDDRRPSAAAITGSTDCDNEYSATGRGIQGH